MPTQMPSSGVPVCTACLSGASKPAARRLAAASPNAPTPGSTIPAAPASPSGDVITSAVAPAASTALYTLRRLPTP